VSNTRQRSTGVIAAALLAAATVPLPATARGEVYALMRQPVYLGVKACSECHAGQAMGHQFSKWRLTAHAGAFASLAQPEAKAIAELSGIPGEPQTAKMCLGCHATAAEAEDWERLDDFHIEDGLQCEACHGPGSEYAVREIMMDREHAMAMGLKMDARDRCLVCHREKGSHTTVLNSPPFDLEASWQRIAHPTPADPPEPTSGAADPPRPGQPGGHKYTGVMACSKCHQGEAFGFQYSKWRDTPHARAFADLASPRGHEIARQAGIQGDPTTSPQCLECHTTGHGRPKADFLAGFDPRDGVQCEACHGPGSDYSPEAIMKDKVAAAEAGLEKPEEAVCLKCHEEAHGKPFNYREAVRAIRHPSRPRALVSKPQYKTPLFPSFTPDGRELWVPCEAGNSVIVVDPVARVKLAEIPIGGQPTAVCFDPPGQRAFVSNRLDDTVSVIDVASRTVIHTLVVGDEPHGVMTDREGRLLYVLNTSIDSISVFDLATMEEIKRLTASRAPWLMALSPDGSRMVVTHTLPRFGGVRDSSLSELAVIDTETALVAERHLVPDANLLQGIAWHPSGEYAVFTLLRTKNLVPMTRLIQGWTITNGLGILWRDGTVDQVLLDQTNRYFPDPAGVIITPDGAYALVTSSGSDRVVVVDLAKLTSMLKAASPEERERVFPNHLGIPTEFIVKSIPTRFSPRGIACAPDGQTAFVANALDDTLTVIDLGRLEAVGEIDLGGAREISKARWGEQLFHSANIAFRRQFSCHSCHPDGHIDGLTYDIEPDGIGLSPVDNRTLRGVNDMAPYKWTGKNPTLKRQCGPRLAVFFTRIDPFTPEQLDAVDNYICTIQRPPNRYRRLDEDLTPSQRRGKAMFERTRTNDGRVVPVEQRCTTCHPPPLFTDGRIHDVGTQGPLDHTARFDAPHLNNIYDSAPYLHDGRSPSLEEIWTVHNPYDQHGITNDMTKDQLNDLIEYLKTL
jgi:YVTN family beta-propeller protein